MVVIRTFVGEDAQKSPKISGDWSAKRTNESELKKGTRTLKIIGLAGANCRFLSISTKTLKSDRKTLQL